MDLLDKIFDGQFERTSKLINFYLKSDLFFKSKIKNGWIWISVVSVISITFGIIAVWDFVEDTGETGPIYLMISLIFIYFGSISRVRIKAVTAKLTLGTMRGENLSFGDIRKEYKDISKFSSAKILEFFGGKWISSGLASSIDKKVFDKNFAGNDEHVVSIVRYLIPYLVCQADNSKENSFESIVSIVDKLPDDFKRFAVEEFVDQKIKNSFFVMLAIPTVLGILGWLITDEVMVILGFMWIGLVASRVFKNLIDLVALVYFSTIYFIAYQDKDIDKEVMEQFILFLQFAQMDLNENREESTKISDNPKASKKMSEDTRNKTLILEVEKELDPADEFNVDEEKESESKEIGELTREIKEIDSSFKRINTIYKAFKENINKGHNFDAIKKFLLKNGYSDDEIDLGQKWIKNKEEVFREFQFNVNENTSITQIVAREKKEEEKSKIKRPPELEERLNKIAAFIRTNLKKGHSKEKITQFLRKKKYARVRIEEAFDLVEHE